MLTCGLFGTSRCNTTLGYFGERVFQRGNIRSHKRRSMRQPRQANKALALIATQLQCIRPRLDVFWGDRQSFDP